MPALPEGIKSADELLKEELAKKRPTATPADNPGPSHRTEPTTAPKAAPEVKEETAPKLAPPKEDKSLKELDDRLAALKEKGNV